MRPFRWINDLFLISNLVNGVDRYEISAASAALHQQQSFKHSIRSNVPLHVASALQGRWIICGSDDGSVRIFDQRTEAIIKSLRHSNSKLLYFLVFPTPNLISHSSVETLVQVVAVRSDFSHIVLSDLMPTPVPYRLIVSGTSSPGTSTIKVWHHTQPSVGLLVSATTPIS
jgi:WD40 repeat protein